MEDLQKLLDAARAYAQDCHDAIATSKNVQFVGGRGMSYQTNNGLFGSAWESGVLNDWAASQIGARLNAPRADWLWREENCPSDLVATIMNRLVQEREEKSLFVRSKGGTVRAVLSDEYSPFDNHELLELVEKAVSTMNTDVKVKRGYVGDEMSAYVLFPAFAVGQDPRGDGKSGGTLHPALHIGNSERGSRRWRISSAVFTGYCENGMIFGYKNKEAVSGVHRHLPKSAMTVLVAAAIEQALASADVVIKAFVDSVAIDIGEVNLSGIVERWSRTYGLSVGEKDNWLHSVIGESARNEREHKPALFDVLNGITSMAQGYEVSRANHMERLAGDMLEHYINNGRVSRGMVLVEQ